MMRFSLTGEIEDDPEGEYKFFRIKSFASGRTPSKEDCVAVSFDFNTYIKNSPTSKHGSV